MTYGSVCSGIEAATAAWQPLGWNAVWFAEVDSFCRATLAYHYPEVRNIGDFTTIRGGWFRRIGATPIDLLVGGTPCQSFSVAGKRLGLDDPRGNLAIEFALLARRLRPRWIVWENVPGVLSSWSDETEGSEGEIWQRNDFDTLLALLGECGYGIAYRVLDAQYFGVPQRRRRVFVVGYFGDWRPAAAVLFERDSLCGRAPARGKAGQGVAGTLGGGSGKRGWCSDTERMTFVPDVAYALNAHPSRRYDAQANETFIAHALRADGFDVSEDGTGRGTPLVPVAFRARGQDGFTVSEIAPPVLQSDGGGSGVPTVLAFSCKDWGADAGDLAPTLRAMPRDGSHPNAGGQIDVVAFQEAQTGVREYDTVGTLRSNGPGHDPVGTRIRSGMAVRRLTPRECERLQGFRDDYTLVPYRGGMAADGPRYKAIGNSMAVPVMRWLGERIEAVDSLLISRNPGKALGVL